MLPWVLVLVWSALQMLIARQVHIQQRGPIDFLTYQIAADKLRAERVRTGRSMKISRSGPHIIDSTSSLRDAGLRILRSIRSTAAPQFY